MSTVRSPSTVVALTAAAVGFYMLLSAGAFDSFSAQIDELQSAILVKRFISYNEWLESAAIIVRQGFPPISVLDLCGSIIVCLNYRTSITTQKSWFESLVSCTLMQFGGTTLTGLLLGQTPSWIISHSAFPALLLAWWLTFFCPYDLYYLIMDKNKVILFLAGMLSAISSGHAVTSWGLDKAAFNAFHVNHTRISQSALTCILCGTLSACGGGLISDWLKFTHSDKAYTLSVTPSMFQIGKFSSTATLNRSFILAVLYYCMLNHTLYMPWKYRCPKEFAHMVISFIQVVNYTVREQYPEIDVFQSLSSFVLRDLFYLTPVVDKSGAEDLAENEKSSSSSSGSGGGKKKDE